MYSLRMQSISLTDLLKTNLYQPLPVFTAVLDKKSHFYNINEYELDVIKRSEENFDKSIINLLKYSRENNVKFDLIYIVNQDCPSYAFRMNGTYEKDKVILSQLNNPTNQEWRKKKHNETIKYMHYNANAKFYNLYTNQHCDNMDVFYEYSQKYSDQIKGYYFQQTPNIAKGAYWFLIDYTQKQKTIHFFTQVASQYENNGVQPKSSYFAYMQLNNLNELYDRDGLLNLIRETLNIQALH